MFLGEVGQINFGESRNELLCVPMLNKTICETNRTYTTYLLIIYIQLIIKYLTLTQCLI